MLVRKWAVWGAVGLASVGIGCASSTGTANNLYSQSANTGPKAAMAKTLQSAKNLPQMAGEMRPNFPVAASNSNKKLKNPAQLHTTYARWQEQLGNFQEARESYDFVLNEDPQSSAALLGLARLDQLSGKNAEAERGFLRALNLQPNDPKTLDALGQFYTSQSRWDEAIEMYQAALMGNPNDTNITYHLAVTLAKKGDIASSFRHFVKTVGEAEAHYNIGYLMQQAGKLDQAEQHLVAALQKKPDLEPAVSVLADVRNKRQTQLMLTSGSQSGVPASTNPVATPTWPNTQFAPAPQHAPAEKQAPFETTGHFAPTQRETTGQIQPWQQQAVPQYQGGPALQQPHVSAPDLPIQTGLKTSDAAWGNSTVTSASNQVNATAHQRHGLTPQQVEQLHNQIANPQR